MRKFLTTTLFTIFAVAVGWYYVPPDFKEKAAAFMGVAASRNTGEIKNFIGDVILPKDPKERREVLINELKNNLNEIKSRTATGVIVEKKIPVDKRVKTKTTQEIISSSEKIIKELKDASGDKSLGEKIGDKVLDAILPSSPPGKQCRQICE